MRRHFVDTSVLAVALGGPHPDREACRAFLQDSARAAGQLHASVELVQELLFHRLRRVQRPVALAQAGQVRAACVLHAFDEAVLDRALELVSVSSVRGRDAVHAATALQAGFAEIVSLDVDFDAVPGLRRVHPGEATT